MPFRQAIVVSSVLNEMEFMKKEMESMYLKILSFVYFICFTGNIKYIYMNAYTKCALFSSLKNVKEQYLCLLYMILKTIILRLKFEIGRIYLFQNTGNTA